MNHIPGALLIWQEEQMLSALSVAANAEPLALFLIALQAGLRPAEPRTLRWTKVELEARLIHIESPRGRVTRTVPMSTAVCAAMKWLAERYGTSEFVLGTKPKEVLQNVLCVWRSAAKKIRLTPF